MLIYIALDVFLSWTFLHLIVEEAGCDNLHPGEVHLVCNKKRKSIFPEQLNKTVKQLNKTVKIDKHYILLQ